MVVYRLTTYDRPTFTICSSLSPTTCDRPTLTNRCLSFPDRQVSLFHLSISRLSGVDLGLWVVGLWVLLVWVCGFVPDFCTNLWRICGFMGLWDLLIVADWYTDLWRICGLWFQRLGLREWWDFEDVGDRLVFKLDLILCFDGLVGFQLGDWCWFYKQRGCRSFDFSGCMLG